MQTNTAYFRQKPSLKVFGCPENHERALVRPKMIKTIVTLVLLSVGLMLFLLLTRLFLALFGFANVFFFFCFQGSVYACGRASGRAGKLAGGQAGESVSKSTGLVRGCRVAWRIWETERCLE